MYVCMYVCMYLYIYIYIYIHIQTNKLQTTSATNIQNNYEAFCGVDFGRRRISPRARRGGLEASEIKMEGLRTSTRYQFTFIHKQQTND